MKKRHISEIGRLIYEILETASILNTKGFLLTVDIIKAFDWLIILFFGCFTEVRYWGALSKMHSNSN